MTLPDERKRAVLATQEFLRGLLDPARTPRVPRAVRSEARCLLKHFPGDFDLQGWDGNAFHTSRRNQEDG